MLVRFLLEPTDIGEVLTSYFLPFFTFLSSFFTLCISYFRPRVTRVTVTSVPRESTIFFGRLIYRISTATIGKGYKVVSLLSAIESADSYIWIKEVFSRMSRNFMNIDFYIKRRTTSNSHSENKYHKVFARDSSYMY